MAVVITLSKSPPTINNTVKHQSSTDNKNIDNQSNDIKTLLRKSEQGDAKAQASLAENYALGLGFVKDDDKAVLQFERAAIQGHVGSQGNLSEAYFKGYGVNGNLVLAYALANIAAASGKAGAATEGLEPLIYAEMKQAEIDYSHEISSKWKVGQPLLDLRYDPNWSPSKQRR